MKTPILAFVLGSAAWASAPGATIEFQVDGAAVPIRAQDADRVIGRIEHLVESAHRNAEVAGAGGKGGLPARPPDGFTKPRSFIHVAYPEPRAFSTVGGVLAATDIWIELPEGDAPGGPLPGPVTLISGGRPLDLSGMSLLLVVDLGIDPALIGHLPRKMREELAKDALAIRKRLEAGGTPAPQEALADDPSGMWKGFTAYHGRVLVEHPIFVLALKDGRLTGKEIAQDPSGEEEETPLLDPVFKDGVLTFTVRIPSDGDRLNPFGSIGSAASAARAFAGAGPRGFGAPTDADEASDLSGGAEGGYVSYVGSLMGATIVGTHRKKVQGGYGMEVTDATWIAMRITPTGIWDVSMHILPADGEAHDKGSPLRAVSGELMKFEFKDLSLTGVWRRAGPNGRRVPETIRSVSLGAQGISFSADVEGPAGRTTYDFKGEFIGSIADDPFNTLPTLTLGPRGPQINDPGSTINMIAGTLRITGPDGKVYASKWRAVRDNGKRARVEMGAPYEVEGPQVRPAKP